MQQFIELLKQFQLRWLRMSEQKQTKQRLNIRVRRGLSWIHSAILADSYMNFTSLIKADTRRDVEAALRWIAENKQ